MRMPALKCSEHPSAQKSDFFSKSVSQPTVLSKILTTASNLLINKEKSMTLELVLQQAYKII